MMKIVRDRINNDVSHDFSHTYRVLKLAKRIGLAEGADLDIVVPAALFHDVIVYKGTRKQGDEHKESARMAKRVLSSIREYPKQKIKDVVYSISVCSFSRNVKPHLLEAKVLQDADLLESTGAISIMRTFASASSMGKEFYNLSDPFCAKRVPEPKKYALDLVVTRLLIAHKRMNTKTAKRMARKRAAFIGRFISELRLELKEAS
jgi:uncharacterized protein